MTTISKDSEYTLPEEFRDIAPYDDTQFREKMQGLVKDPSLDTPYATSCPTWTTPNSAANC